MFDMAWELGRLYDTGSVTKPSLSENITVRTAVNM
jgi:hypothetical protein